MATTWTVVYRTSKFANAFRQTGFAGDWEAAMTHAAKVYADLGVEDAEVYYVASTDEVVYVESGRAVRIAPTAEQKAAAEARRLKVRAILVRHTEGESRGYSPLLPFGRRVGLESPFEVAAYAVDHGMDWDAISRTQW